MKTVYAFLIIALLATTIFAGQQFSVPPCKKVSIEVDVARSVEPVNRRVMGLCLIYCQPPYDQRYIDLFKGVLDGTSGHLWGGCTWEDPPVSASNSLLQAMPFASAVGIEDLYYMLPDSKISRKAHYVSATDNNLDAKHQPAERARLFNYLNNTPHQGFPNGFGINRFRVWDEPQFPSNGAWPPEDYARYLVDMAKAIREVDPTVQIGAGVNEGDMEWNRRMLTSIAAMDIEAIRFIEPHPFSFAWIKAREEIDEYYARVSESEVHRGRIREKIKLIQELGRGNWRLDACAWNIHPPGWQPPYHVSTDMAVGVHVAAMFGMFWEEGVHAAQFFQFSSKRGQEEGHFYIVRDDGEDLHLMPSGEVFKLYGTYFRGARLAPVVTTPSFSYQTKWMEEAIEVPLMTAHGAYDQQHQRLVMVVANKHKQDTSQTDVSIDNFVPSIHEAELVAITSETPTSTIPVVTRSKLKLPLGPNPRLTVECPPHSVTGVIISGKVAKPESESLPGSMAFIRQWTIADIYKSVTDNDFNAPLKEYEEKNRFGFKSYDADSTGYVNLVSMLDISGLSGMLEKGYFADAYTWIFSPGKRTVEITGGFNERATVYLNGQKVSGVVSCRGVNPEPDDYTSSIVLNPGWNKLGVRVLSGGNGMGFMLAIDKKIDFRFATGLEPPWPRQWTQLAENTYINKEVDPEKSFYQEPVLHLAKPGSVLRRGFLHWDLSGIPEEHQGRIASRIVLHPAWTKGDGTVWLTEITSPWEKETVSYNTQPSRGGTVGEKIDVKDDIWVFSGKELDQLIDKWIGDNSLNHGVAIDTDISYHCGFYGGNITGKHIDKAAVLEFTLADR
ncbi:MAG: DNRLRE domain-containing protein [Victivallales bacterium]|nr:DNRLRE domain-containing protein [Victivallales bacterium]